MGKAASRQGGRGAVMASVEHDVIVGLPLIRGCSCIRSLVPHILYVCVESWISSAHNIYRDVDEPRRRSDGSFTRQGCRPRRVGKAG